jgi:micrococcal nuclease
MSLRKIAVTSAVITIAAIMATVFVGYAMTSTAGPGAGIVVTAAPRSTPTLVLPIISGVDGDTIRTRIDALPCPLCNVSIRIRGIDTPEKGARAKCQQEADLAVQASKMTKSLIGDTKAMTVHQFAWDKYGGRIDGIVVINGHNVGDELIAAGLARPYTGKGPKPNWCAG